MIDESNSSYRINFKAWNTIVKEGMRISYNHISSNIKEIDRTMLSVNNESILIKFTKAKVKSSKSELSRENHLNVIISLMHTFFYMFIYSSTLSTNSSLIKSFGSDPVLSGLIMGMTPLFAISSTVICSKWTITSYKRPMVFTTICYIFGNFLYAFSAYFKSLMILAIGRSLIGLGSGRMVNRRYLIEFIPKTELSKYSLYYIMFGALGMSAG